MKTQELKMPASQNLVAATRQIPAISACIGHRRIARRRCVGESALLYICFLFLPFSFRASAQSYSINWYKVAGGGGTSTNGQYAISGTIGQHDASTAMSGGNYSLTGGFWSLYAVQTPGAPILTITYANNQAIVSWSPSVTGWTLQTNSNIGTTNWVNFSGTVVNNTVTNSPPKGMLFFRLVHP
jgi:hypothetical protein